MRLFGRKREPERPPPTVAPGLRRWMERNAPPEPPANVQGLLEELGLPARTSETGSVLDAEGTEVSVSAPEGAGCLHVVGLGPRGAGELGAGRLLGPITANAGSLGGHLALRGLGGEERLVALAKPPVHGIEAGAMALSVEEVLRLGRGLPAGGEGEATEQRLRALRTGRRPGEEDVRARVESCLDELGLAWGPLAGDGTAGWEVTLDPGPAELWLRGHGEALALTLVAVEMEMIEADEELLSFINEESDLAGAWYAQGERDGVRWLELTTTIATTALAPAALAHALLELTTGFLQLFERLAR